MNSEKIQMSARVISATQAAGDPAGRFADLIDLIAELIAEQKLKEIQSKLGDREVEDKQSLQNRKVDICRIPDSGK